MQVKLFDNAIDELACLSYWGILDQEKGYMDTATFIRLLKMFRFSLPDWSPESIAREFEWLMKWNAVDITNPTFNFARLIFLERGL